MHVIRKILKCGGYLYVSNQGGQTRSLHHAIRFDCCDIAQIIAGKEFKVIPFHVAEMDHIAAESHITRLHSSGNHQPE